MIPAMITSGDVMTNKLVTIHSEQSLEEAIALFKKHKIDHLIVKNAEKTVGILSKTDMYKRLLSLIEETTGQTYSKLLLANTTAESIMTVNPICVEVSEPVRNAIEILLAGAFHAVPVMENGNIIGIITSKDILEESVKG